MCIFQAPPGSDTDALVTVMAMRTLDEMSSAVSAHPAPSTWAKETFGADSHNRLLVLPEYTRFELEEKNRR